MLDIRKLNARGSNLMRYQVCITTDPASTTAYTSYRIYNTYTSWSATGAGAHNSCLVTVLRTRYMLFEFQWSDCTADTAVSGEDCADRSRYQCTSWTQRSGSQSDRPRPRPRPRRRGPTLPCLCRARLLLQRKRRGHACEVDFFFFLAACGLSCPV